MRRVLACAFVLVLQLAFAIGLSRPAVAQVAKPSKAPKQSAKTPSGPVVRPYGTTTLAIDNNGNVEPTRAPNAGPFTTQNFTITNLSSTRINAISLSCAQTGSAICGSVSPAYISSLNAGASANATVTYTTGAAGSAAIGIQADNDLGTVSAVGYMYFQVVAPPPPPPPGKPVAMTLKNYDGDNRDRSLCFTTGAGEAAGWECGDLAVTHSLPSYATMGKDRALTFVYNSAQAHPWVSVFAVVTQGGTQLGPDSVFARLTIDNTALDSVTYPGWGATNSQVTRQIGLSVDAVAKNIPYGFHRFTLLVRNKYIGHAQYDDSLTGNVMVLDKQNSSFGRGWDIAGMEHIDCFTPWPGCDMLWSSGDGSVKRYTYIGTNGRGNNAWVAPLGGYRDTLEYDGAAQVHYRTLRHGVKVVYDPGGFHIRTVGPTGQATRFFWHTNPSTGTRLLDSIAVPPTPVTGNPIAGTVYRLYYTSGDKLDHIIDPANRTVIASVVGGNLVSITDPDLQTTRFSYTGATSGFMTSRQTRRGPATNYVYAGPRLTRIATPLQQRAGMIDSAITQIAPWDTMGVLLPGPGIRTAPDTADVATRVSGPRAGVADDAVIRVDRWGAPVSITGPMGDVSTLWRTDPKVPAAVTKVRWPDGHIDSLAYDGRNNLLEVRDSTRHLDNRATTVTRWQYSSPNTADSPTDMYDAANVHTQYAYNGWGLLSQLTAPNNHVTQYNFETADLSRQGQLRGVVDLQVPTWDSTTRAEPPANLRTGFAFNALGNVVADTSPMGRVRQYSRDAAQRVTDFYDAAGYRTEYVYDPLNRVTQIKQHVEQPGTPAASYPADPGATLPLVTTMTYTNDALTSVLDPRQVPRSFTYDLANRQVTETDDYNVVETRYYNEAGALDSVRTRRGNVVRHVYDAGGRKAKMAWPAQDYGSAADSVLYNYDAMGRLTAASSVGQQITRTYDGAGRILSEASSASGTTQSYSYDAAGRRSGWRTGPAGNRLVSDSVTYSYDGVTGDLHAITVRWRQGRSALALAADDSVVFGWDSLGRRDKLVYSNGATVRYLYDGDGQLRALCSSHTWASPPPNDQFRSQLVQDWVDANGRVRTTNAGGPGRAVSGCPLGLELGGKITFTYDARGQMTSRLAGADQGWFTYDGSGNIVTNRGPLYTFVDSTDTPHNRLARHLNSSVSPNQWWIYAYNADGSRLGENSCTPSVDCQHIQPGYREYAYDGLGRMAGIWDDKCTAFVTGFGCGASGIMPTAQCRYDPVGRLVQPCEQGIGYLGFDGENVVRTGPDGDVNGSAYTWTFVHGPGIDDPLLGYYPGSTGVKAYFLTDGTGRQYAVANASGLSLTDINETADAAAYLDHAGKYAGGTRSSNGFGADRHSTKTAPGLSFFRNRAYDQATGRWLQEDPAGVAGGLNLYAFNGNNPVAYTDPFGLDPCELSSAWTECIAQGIANWGASRGDAVGNVALNAGAALNAGLEATGLNALASAGNDIGSGHVGRGLVVAAALTAGPAVVGRGLGAASAGLRSLFAESGGLANETIIGVRTALKESGFAMRLADNKKGYLFTNAAGEQVRIMRGAKGWYLRVRNAAGNYLDAAGNPGGRATTHMPIRSE